MQKYGAWLIGAAGGAVALASQVSVQQAASNLSGWLHLLGLDQIATAFSRPWSDMAGFVGGIIAVIAATAWMRLADKYAAKIIKAPEPGLKGGFTLRPDTPLADALNFAATGVWEEPVGDPDGYLVALQKAIDDFTTLASQDRIRVFYRSPFKDSPPQFLGGTCWFAHRIDLLDVLNGEALLRRRKDGSRIETAHDLRVCRAEWDANWGYLRSTLP